MLGRKAPRRYSPPSAGSGSAYRFATIQMDCRDARVIVGVYPLAGFDKLLHYRVPEELRAQVGVGGLVRVPVRATLQLGIVGEIGAPKDFPIEKLKSVAQVVYPLFPRWQSFDLLELARWMATYYAAPLDTIIETMIPVAVRRGMGIKQEKLLSVARPWRRRRSGPRWSAGLRSRRSSTRSSSSEFRPQAKGLVLSRLEVSAPTVAALVHRGLVREGDAPA